MKQDSDQLVKGALLLTLAGMISKILSAGYRIPLQNLTGDLGFYTYQQIYPFISLLMILGFYGLPSAVSKLATERLKSSQSLSMNGFYKPVFFMMASTSAVLGIALYMSAPFISQWIGDPFLTRAYQWIACGFFFIPFMALTRGVFQAMYDMLPTACSQIGEQLLRVSLIILGAYLVATGYLEVSAISDIGAIATISGMLVATVILLWFVKKRLVIDYEPQSGPWLMYAKTIWLMGIVASCHHLILILIQMVDVFTIVPALMDYGLTALEAKATKGIFDRGYPLIQLGTIIGSSFALSFIPAATNYQKDFNHVHSGLKICVYLSWGAMIGLIFTFTEVNLLLFQDTHGTIHLQILSLAILLCSIVITGIAILQALNHYVTTACYVVLALVLKWLFNILLVPVWGIMGSAIATIAVLIGLCILVIIELNKSLPQFSWFKQLNYGALLRSTMFMVSYIILMKLMFQPLLISTRWGLFVYVIAVVVIGGFLYLYVLIKSAALSEEELQALPMSSIFKKWI